jgi:hypothetical protein
MGEGILGKLQHERAVNRILLEIMVYDSGGHTYSEMVKGIDDILEEMVEFGRQEMVCRMSAAEVEK